MGEMVMRPFRPHNTGAQVFNLSPDGEDTKDGKGNGWAGLTALLEDHQSPVRPKVEYLKPNHNNHKTISGQTVTWKFL
jgi:hypothetical protein